MKNLLISIITILALVGCGGAEERKAAYMKKATESFEAGDFKKAKVDAKNVLQIDPKDSEAIYLLGVIAEIDRDYRKAVGYYNLAIELDSNNTKARYNLGKFYLQLSDNEKAQEEADKIESILPGSSLAKALGGAIAFSQKKYSEAIEILNGIKKENRSEDDIILLSASHYGAGDVDKTLEILIEGVEKYTKSVALRVILAKTYIGKENQEEALRYLNEIIDIEPTNPAHYRTLSNYYETLGEMDKAKNVYYELINSDPENETYQLMLVQYIATKSGEPAAIEHLKTLLSKFPDVDSYSILYAKFELKNDNKQASIDILEKIIAQQRSEKGVLDAKNMLASIKAFDEDLEGAKILLNDVLTTTPSDIDANFMLAKVLFSEKKSSEAIGPLRVVIRENPKNAEAYLLLAKAHENLGENNLMHDVISQGVRENPNNKLLEDNYIQLLLDTGKHEYALSVIQESRRVKKLPTETKLLRAKVYLLNGKYPEAEVIGNELVESHPDKDSGYKILADVYAKQSYFDETEDVLKKGIEASNSADLLIPYVKLLVQLDKSDAAISFLKEYDVHKPLVSTMLAELYITKKDIPTASQYYKDAIKENPKWDTPYYALGVLQSDNGDVAGAIETYKSAVAQFAENIKPKVMLATTYHQHGDIDKSIDLYRKIIDQDPDNALIINNLATILAENSTDASALDEALKLVEKIKDIENVAIRDTVAWVYVKNAKYDQAIEIFNEIIAKRSDIGVFKYHLGVAHYHNGDASLASKYLEEAVAMQNDAPWKKEANNLISKLNQG